MRKDVTITRKICRFNEKRSRYNEKICHFNEKRSRYNEKRHNWVEKILCGWQYLAYLSTLKKVHFTIMSNKCFTLKCHYKFNNLVLCFKKSILTNILKHKHFIWTVVCYLIFHLKVVYFKCTKLSTLPFKMCNYRYKNIWIEIAFKYILVYRCQCIRQSTLTRFQRQSI